MSDADIALKNLSNHQQHGKSDVALDGKFMGSGETRLVGDFLASRQGPALNMDLAIEHTDLTSMNDILRAYGRFDVTAGQLSMSSQVCIRDE